MTQQEALTRLVKAIRHLEAAEEIFEDLQLEAYTPDFEVKDGWEAISTLDGILQDFRYHRLQRVLRFVHRWQTTGKKPSGDPYFDVY